jgi:hypothetical protein
VGFGLRIISPGLTSAIPSSAAAFSLIMSLSITTLLYAEICYPGSPSTFLSLCLALKIAFEVILSCQCLSMTPSCAIYNTMATIKLTSLVYEILYRDIIDWQRLRNPLKNYATKGFWDSSVLLWLHATIIVGFRMDVAVEDLPYLGPEFNSELLYEQFQPHWQRCTYMDLLFPCFSFFVRNLTLMTGHR